MNRQEYCELGLYTDELVERMEDGRLVKDHLINHGEDFTGGPEQLALEKFITYISSCGYVLMETRLQKEGVAYYGI